MLGVNIGAQLDRFKDSFLVAAAKAGSEEEVASLLDIGADVNWIPPDDSAETALLAACRNGHRSVVTMLLATGADAAHRNNNGDTALHLACRRGDHGLATLLLHNGSPELLRAQNAAGQFPVDAARAKGFEQLARHLDQFSTRNQSATTGERDGNAELRQAYPHSESKTADHEEEADSKDLAPDRTGTSSSSWQGMTATLAANGRRQTQGAVRVTTSEGLRSTRPQGPPLSARRDEHTAAPGPPSRRPSQGPSDTEESASEEDYDDSESDAGSLSDTSNFSEQGLDDERIQASRPVEDIEDSLEVEEDLPDDRASNARHQRESKDAQQHSPSAFQRSVPKDDAKAPARTPRESKLQEPDAHQTVEALRRRVLEEQTLREAAQNKADAIREQSAKIWTNLMETQETEKKLRGERDRLKLQVRRLNGHELGKMSISELEALEKELKDSLQRVSSEKENKLRSQIDGEREQRLCVICQEEEKNMPVAAMPPPVPVPIVFPAERAHNLPVVPKRDSPEDRRLCIACVRISAHKGGAVLRTVIAAILV